jgi:hypothetical protein
MNGIRATAGALLLRRSRSQSVQIHLTREADMKRSAFLSVIAAGVVALAAWQLASPGAPRHSAVAAAPNAPAPAATISTTAPATQAGYVAHFDASGRLVEEPIAGDENLAAALSRSVNTSSEGLVEVASPVPGGGITVDLQGRFQTTATATIGGDGKLNVPCLTNEAEVQSLTSTTPANPTAAKE